MQSKHLAVLLLPFLLSAQDAPGDGGPANEAELDFPLGIALAPDGSLYVSERGADRVRRVDPETGTISTYAGTGTAGFSGDGGPAAAAEISSPDSIDVDAGGNLYIADRGNERIRRVDARTGIITTVVGNGERAASDDGTAVREASLMGPYYVRIVDGNELWFTDTDSNRVMRVDSSAGILEVLAGSGARGFGGDGDYAFEAAFARPHVVLKLRSGDIVIGDSFNQRIRIVDHESGIVDTLAGSGTQGVAPDGTKLLDAAFAYFGEIHELENGDLLVTEWMNGRVLRLDLEAGVLHVLAGTGADEGSMADGQHPRATRFNRLADCVFDGQGRLLVVAAADGLVRRIDFEHETVETVVGRPPGTERSASDAGR